MAVNQRRQHSNSITWNTDMYINRHNTIHITTSNVDNNKEQVVNVLWQKGHIAISQGRFSGIRQVAPVCTSPNTCFLGSPEFTTQTASRLVQPFLQSVTHGRVLLVISGYVLSPKNCAIAWAIWTPSTTWFHGSTQILNPNGISISPAIFAQLTAERHYTLQWAALFPAKLPLSIGGPAPTSNT